MWSFWERESFVGTRTLVVVGSGIVGLNAALEYKHLHPKSKVLVTEAGALPAGASTKNAGFACFGSPTELLMDLEQHPESLVSSIIKKRWEGLKSLRSLLGDVGLGYEEPGSYELFLEDDQAAFEKSKNALFRLNKMAKNVLGFEPYQIAPGIIEKNGFKQVIGAIQNVGEGQIDTGKMMRSLLKLCKEKGIEILNGLRVQEIEDGGNQIAVYTSEGQILTDHCLIATNGFAKKLLPEIHVEPARAQVLITQPIQDLQIRGTYHFDSGYYYFRNVGNRILFGGGRNLDFAGETTAEHEINPEIHSELDRLLRAVILPGRSVDVDMRWTGIMGVGKDKLPIVKPISDRLFCAVKLGGMGVAIGTQTGREAARLIGG